MGAGVAVEDAPDALPVQEAAPRIAVVGPGAMGCLFGAILSEAGHEVWLIDHRPERARLLVEHGVTVEGIGGTRTVPINASAEPATIGHCQIVVFAVKAYDTPAAAQECVGLSGPATTVVTLQNGLGNVEALAAAFDPERVVAGATSHGATLLGVGHVRHAGTGPTVLAPVNAPSAGAIHESPLQQHNAAEGAAVLFRAAGLETTVAADVASVIWSKVVVNAAVNPLTALTRLTNGQLLEFPGLRESLEAVAEETAKVARLCGANLSYDNAAHEVVEVCERTACNRSSMLQDVLAGRRTEIESLNGAVVYAAKARGFEAPINMVLAALVRGICHSEQSKAE